MQSLFHSALRHPCFCHHFGFGRQDFILVSPLSSAPLVFPASSPAAPVPPPPRPPRPPAPQPPGSVIQSFSATARNALQPHSPPTAPQTTTTTTKRVTVLITSMCLYCEGKAGGRGTDEATNSKGLRSLLNLALCTKTLKSSCVRGLPRATG